MDESKKAFEKHLRLMEINDHYWSAAELKYHLKPGEEFDPLWREVLFSRSAASQTLYPLVDKEKRGFVFWAVAAIQEKCHQLDILAKDFHWRLPNRENKEERFLALVREAWESSRIEGAVTTRQRAEELIRTGKPGKTKSEIMVVNNYLAMEKILGMGNQDLTLAHFRELHNLLTRQTWDKEDLGGVLRHSDDVVVYDQARETVAFVPPPAAEVPKRMEVLLQLANDRLPSLSLHPVSSFIHPLVKAAVLHFYLVYIHPFYDGNGRLARALVYCTLVRSGYEFIKLLSISSVIAAHRRRYYESLANSEGATADLTYFVKAHTDMLMETVAALGNRVKKAWDLLELRERLLSKNIRLTRFQERLLRAFLQKTDRPWTIRQAQIHLNCVYQTARTTLFKLESFGLLKKDRVGKAFLFRFDPRVNL